MTEHPRPWTCQYSEAALCWWICDANGRRIQHTEKEWFAKYVVDLANAAEVHSCGGGVAEGERTNIMSVNNGGHAFPRGGDGECPHDGMSLRDYFAAKALQGDWADGGFNVDQPREFLEERAFMYYRMADAMLQAREKGGTQ